MDKIKELSPKVTRNNDPLRRHMAGEKPQGSILLRLVPIRHIQGLFCLSLAAIAVAFAGCSQEPVVPVETVRPSAEVKPAASIIRTEREAQKQIALATVDEVIKGFKIVHRRNPENLSELVQAGFINALPDLPNGMLFTYNPEAGEVGAEEIGTVDGADRETALE